MTKKKIHLGEKNATRLLICSRFDVFLTPVSGPRVAFEQTAPSDGDFPLSGRQTQARRREKIQKEGGAYLEEKEEGGKRKKNPSAILKWNFFHHCPTSLKPLARRVWCTSTEKKQTL